jgi:hypothetical protein
LRGHGAWAGQGPELFFAGAAAGTFPVFRQVLEFSARRNLTFLVTPGGVVNVAAVADLALVHLFGFGHFSLPLRFNDFALKYFVIITD